MFNRYQSGEFADKAKAKIWLSKMLEIGDEKGTLYAADVLMQDPNPAPDDAIALLKNSYGLKPSPKIAASLSQIYSGQNDAPHALEWARAMLLIPSGPNRYFYPLSVLGEIPATAQSAPALLEMLQTVAGRDDKADASKANLTLARIYEGTEANWSDLVAPDLARSGAFYRQAAQADWRATGEAAQFFINSGDATSAEALFERAVQSTDYGAGIAVIEGAKFWSRRTDGKADGDKAIEFLKLSTGADARWNYPVAAEIGDILRLGKGRAKDEAKAVEWYRYGVKKHQEISAQKLAFCLWNGIGAPQDEAAALAVLDDVKTWSGFGGTTERDRRAIAFDAVRYRYLQAARATENNAKTIKDFAPQFLKFAQEGEPQAQVLIGSVMLGDAWRPSGASVQDGWNWIEKAAVSNPRAKFMQGARLLGLYESDPKKSGGKLADRPRAVELLFAAAQSEEAAAGNVLALCYREGWGVEKDAAQQRKWLEWGAKNRDLAAAHSLCEFLLASPDARDQRQMLSLARRYATLGDGWSQNFLGVALFKGVGGKTDAPEALQWLDKAAQNGDWFAARSAAKIRFIGALGVPPQGAAALTALEEFSIKSSDFALLMMKLYAGEDETHPWFAPDLGKARTWIAKIDDVAELEQKAAMEKGGFNSAPYQHAVANTLAARDLDEKLDARQAAPKTKPKVAPKTTTKPTTSVLKSLELKPIAPAFKAPKK